MPGNAYLAVKDYVTAISCFDLALKTLPGAEQEDVYLSNRATALFRMGQCRERPSWESYSSMLQIVDVSDASVT